MVLTAHVHNFQRIERDIAGDGPTPFIVAGHGGYYHLHNLNRGVENGTVDDQTGARLVASDDKRHGYLTLTVDRQTIRGVMTAIDNQTGDPAPAPADDFQYPAQPRFLPDGVTISL
jgi:hypothetical protein